MELKPDFFIGGAQKSGTSTLASWMAAHPECYITEPKEPRVFSKQSNLTAVEPYQQFVADINLAKERLFCDATVTYLYEDYVAQRIHTALGLHPAKFIFILREPASRTVSSYYHIFKRGHDLRGLEELYGNEFGALEEEILREEEGILNAQKQNRLSVDKYVDKYDDPLSSFRYLKNSDYLPQLQRYAELFGRENICVLFFEELLSDRDAVLNKVCDFLGIEAFEKGTEIRERKNPTRIPVYLSYAWMRNRPTVFLCKGVQYVWSRLLGLSDECFYRAYDKNEAKYYTEKLKPLFQGRNAELSSYLEIDLKSYGW